MRGVKNTRPGGEAGVGMLVFCASESNQPTAASQLNSYPLGRLLDVLNHCVEFLQKNLSVVADAVQIGAKARYALDNPTGFLDVLVTHAAQR